MMVDMLLSFLFWMDFRRIARLQIPNLELAVFIFPRLRSYACRLLLLCLHVYKNLLY